MEFLGYEPPEHSLGYNCIYKVTVAEQGHQSYCAYYAATLDEIKEFCTKEVRVSRKSPYTVEIMLEQNGSPLWSGVVGDGLLQREYPPGYLRDMDVPLLYTTGNYNPPGAIP